MKTPTIIKNEGIFFEDFIKGDIYIHPLGRTITDVDNIWFTNLTMNTQQLHFNYEYAKESEYKKPIVNSCLTLSIATGLSVIDFGRNLFTNLGWEDVKLPNPLFINDTITARSLILKTKESKSNPDVGIITVQTFGTNQHGVVVIDFKRIFMVYKKGVR
jgi:acyl dehydratase